MRNPLMDAAEKLYAKDATAFGIGDTVIVTIRIVEGDKERLQDFEGTVIARKGRGLNTMFTVRRLLGNEGIERTFPMYSPKIASIKTTRLGKIRRAKLYFLRARVGKARKLRERRVRHQAKPAAAAAPSESAK